MFSTIAAVIAWISSIASLFLQSWLLVKNRSVLKAVRLWQTAAIGIFIAIGITFGYSLILISPELNNLGRLVIRLLIPPIMVSLVLGVYWSIQAAKFMQQQQEIIQQKMDFISLATHELGTPLTSILGYAELLTRVNLPVEAQTYLDGLYTGTARLRVIKRYNDALQKSLEVKPTHLQSTIQGVLDLSETWAATRRQYGSLPIYVDCPDVVIEADESRIETAVMIMVSNALKATKTAVWIKVDLGADLVAIQVKNDGEQIDPPDLEKLFKPMTQLDISSTRQFEGIGMGLYTLQQIAKIHKGVVHLDSSPERTRITLILPVYQS